MSPIIYVAIGFLLGAVFAKWRIDSQMRSHQEVSDKVINPEQIEKKQENLDKVLELLEQQGELSNDIVEKALGISNATAGRYLQELESQGELVQVGTIGQGVRYKKA